MARGRFITFEGGEGAGKSTQVRRLASRLAASGLEVVTTREPGGSPGAETIRDIVLKGAADRWSPVTETLLMYAARRDHIERVIRPALERGAWVVCDRFADSTRAYQGAAGGTAPELIGALERHVLEDIRPDLTLVFDLPPEAGLARAEARAGAEMRFESKGLAFHQRLRDGFLAIAAARADHVARTIVPALERGAWVVCDRFLDSSLAYQGGAGGVGTEAVLRLHEVGSRGLLPDRTLLLDLGLDAGAARAADRDEGSPDRFGRKSGAYHAEVAASFRALAERWPDRFRIVDAGGSPDEVTQRLVAALEDLA